VAAAVDWNVTVTRLRALEAVGFHLDRLPEGGYRFTCWVPAAQAGRTSRVEAMAATEAEAVRLALERAERARRPAR
jgi:hypothetical protein